MVHVNLKSAAKAHTVLAVDVSVCDLPRVNATLQQLAAKELPPPGPIEGSCEPPVYPDDVQALGLPTAPRFFGELQFSPCPGTHLTLITGSLTGQMPFRCQTCLNPFIDQLHIEVRLAHVLSEEKEINVPDGFEALVIDRQDVTLVEILEDDILLSLPAFPKHPVGQCEPLVQLDDADEVKKKLSPFAGLKALLQDTHSGE